VSKSATVSLPGNDYDVDQALCGRRVELPSDPYDPEVAEAYHAGRPFGHAVPHHVSRHLHPQAQGPDDQQRPVSEIDCLRLICDEHERDWLARRIIYQFHDAADGEDDGGGGDGKHDDTTTRTARRWQRQRGDSVSLSQLQPYSVSAACRSLANWRRGLPLQAHPRPAPGSSS